MFYKKFLPIRSINSLIEKIIQEKTLFCDYYSSCSEFYTCSSFIGTGKLYHICGSRYNFFQNSLAFIVFLNFHMRPERQDFMTSVADFEDLHSVNFSKSTQLYCLYFRKYYYQIVHFKFSQCRLNCCCFFVQCIKYVRSRIFLDQIRAFG